MHRTSNVSFRTSAFAIGCAALFVSVAVAGLPHASHAQATSDDQLSATVRASILKDPRSSSLTPQQIDAMVQALTSKAQAQGVTVQDLTYVPGKKGVAVPGVTDVPLTSASEPDPCAGSAWCAWGEYFGSGIVRHPVYSSYWILSLLLIIIVWHMRKNMHLFAEEQKREVPAIGGQA